MAARRFRGGIIVALFALTVVGGSGVAHAAHEVTNETVTSFDGTTIAISIFKPDGASASSQVPLILSSHGWGGNRAKTIDSVAAWLNDGFGILSFDQRGHGESGGLANVQDPEFEAKDVSAVIDRAAQLDWVRHDLDGNGNPIANDPVLGAIGGSYGGGYQTMGALTEIRSTGDTRFNALAPEITWHDLPESLAPQGVVRTVWVSALYAVAPPHPTWMDEAFVVGSATGTFPDGTVPGTENIKERFYQHSPKAFSDAGIELDIPVLIGQGSTDNLFNLNQGLHNFDDVLSDAARSRSLFVGYNGGHVLPETLPLSTNVASNACGNFSALSRAFFKQVFLGQDPSGLLPGRYNIASNDGTRCISTNSVETDTTVPVEIGTVATQTSAGAPVALKLADGPLTIAGIPRLTGSLTTVGVDARAFFGLAVGTNVADARVVQNNVMPVRSLLPAVQEPLNAELPGIGVDIPAGQSLFLTVSPVSSMFAGHVSRTPGAVLIENAAVELPVVN